MKISTRLSAFLLGILFVLALGGIFDSCKKDSTSPNNTDNNVSVQNNAFSPNSITVSVNSTVTWTNKDSYAHTVTSTGGNDTYDSGNINAGGTYTHKFTAAGTYNYKCTLHSGMSGTVVVQ
jgi:plastocyanin